MKNLLSEPQIKEGHANYINCSCFNVHSISAVSSQRHKREEKNEAAINHRLRNECYKPTHSTMTFTP